MTHGEIRTQIQGAIDYLNANPTEALYTDSHATARMDDLDELMVHVDGPDGAHITTDMPASVGGSNAKPSPGWYLRAAEASCVATLIAMRAAHQGMRLAALQVTVDSESDDRGILGVDANVPSGPLSARVAVRLRVVGASDDQLRHLVDWAVEHCPVTDAVRRAIPMTVEVEIS